jgi:hypothetical protein
MLGSRKLIIAHEGLWVRSFAASSRFKLRPAYRLTLSRAFPYGWGQEGLLTALSRLIISPTRFRSLGPFAVSTKIEVSGRAEW